MAPAHGGGAQVPGAHVNDIASSGTGLVGVGEERSRTLFGSDGSPAMWNLTDGARESFEMPSLRSLGFGYLVGGFRLSDGIEGIVSSGDALVAYTGGLQVWDGWRDGALDPREAWASLVLVEDSGRWMPHLLTDFAIVDVAPRRNGILAVAARTPESDTVPFGLSDGTEIQRAATPMSSLFFSTDGLSWQPVTESPHYQQPMLAPDGLGGALVVDLANADGQQWTVTHVEEG